MPKKTFFNMRIQSEILEAVDRAAKQTYQTRTEWIRTALLTQLGAAGFHPGTPETLQPERARRGQKG